MPKPKQWITTATGVRKCHERTVAFVTNDNQVWLRFEYYPSNHSSLTVPTMEFAATTQYITQEERENYPKVVWERSRIKMM